MQTTCTFPALYHIEVVDAFHWIAQGRANKIVTLTGGDGDFVIGVNCTQVLENIANVRVTVLLHPQLLLARTAQEWGAVAEVVPRSSAQWQSAQPRAGSGSNQV